jgi:hypothetical protein
MPKMTPASIVALAALIVWLFWMDRPVHWLFWTILSAMIVVALVGFVRRPR